MSSGQEERLLRIHARGSGAGERVGKRALGSGGGRLSSEVAPTRTPGGGRAGAPRGDLLAAAGGMAASWGKEVRSPLGHLPSGKRWVMDSLPAPSLKEKTLTLWQGGEEDIGSGRLRSGSTRSHPRHQGTQRGEIPYLLQDVLT